MKCRSGRSDAVALDPFICRQLSLSWLCRIGFLFGCAVWSTGVICRADFELSGRQLLTALKWRCVSPHARERWFQVRNSASPAHKTGEGNEEHRT
jgi:hypothetical protein